MTPEELAAVGLRLDVDGAVATVTLDRPEVRNAQTPAMWLALAEVGAALPDDVRVVVVTGEGGTFSGGLDRVRSGSHTCMAWRPTPTPSIPCFPCPSWPRTSG